MKLTVFTNEGNAMDVEIMDSFAANEFVFYFGNEISIEKLFHLANANSKLERKLVLSNPLNALYLSTAKSLTRKTDLFGHLCSVVEYVYKIANNRDDLAVYESFLEALFTIKGDTAATNLLYKAINEKNCRLKRVVELWEQDKNDISELNGKNLADIYEKLILRKRKFENKTISYSPFSYIKDTTVDDIVFKCAPDTATLAEAERKLHVSVYSCYVHRDTERSVIVLGYKNDIPVIVLEVVNGVLEQAVLERCQSLGEKEIAIVKEWANINDIYACSCRDLNCKPMLLESFEA